MPVDAASGRRPNTELAQRSGACAVVGQSATSKYMRRRSIEASGLAHEARFSVVILRFRDQS